MPEACVQEAILVVPYLRVMAALVAVEEFLQPSGCILELYKWKVKYTGVGSLKAKEYVSNLPETASI